VIVVPTPTPSGRSERSAPPSPRRAWYPVAASDEVGRHLLARRVLDTPVVLYRTRAGDAVALEDRCAHRPVRLSGGTLEDDQLRAPYTGFSYAPDGTCVSVPTQDEVPYGAGVRSFPVRDDGSLVWVWLGDAGLASLRTPPSTDVLRAEGWTTFGGVLETRAAVRLLHENFCDITHVAELDSEIAPPALTTGPTPPLEVEVSETSVRFRRSFPEAPLAPWHAQTLGLPEGSRHRQVEEGHFVAPGFWVDTWSVEVSGHGDRDGRHTFVFSHALVPESESRTRHAWFVSRNFARTAAVDGVLKPLFAAYYERVGEVLKEMQEVLELEGVRPEVGVAADAAISHVHRILNRMIAEDAQ
jgi:vanillate O-demethylase monooxygenase subunit